jgi:uncharacterized protein YukE
MATIGRIEFAAVRAYSNNMKNSAVNLREILNDMKKNMSRLEESLSSPASKSLYEKFLSLSTKLEDFPLKVETYSKFLDGVVERYQANEASLQSEINT